MKTAILIFGLDGATWKLLDPWLKAGYLPFLRSLIRRGLTANLESTIPPLTSTAWTTFQTGVNPAKHNIFGFYHPSGRLYNSRDIRQPTFWQIAGRYHKQSAIINMPLTYPIRPNNGYLVSSFLTPPGSNFAYPHQLQTKLEQNGYQIDLPFNEHGFAPETPLSPAAKRTLHQQIMALIASREKAALYIAKQKPWDIFFVLFKATDLSQHFFWDQKETLRVYQRIDRAMAKIVSIYQTAYRNVKINIFVVSDHGFHPISKYDIALYPLITRLGFLPHRPGWFLKALRGFRKLSKAKFITKLAFPTQPRIFSYGLSWPDAPQKVIAQLAKQLSKTTYRGQKIFQTIRIVKPTLPTGPRILWLTNPAFAPNPDPLSGRLVYPKVTALKAHHYADPKGVLIAAGPQIQSKRKRQGLRLVDMAGNILRLLGIPTSANIDSRLYPGLFNFPHLIAPPLKPQAPRANHKTKQADDAIVIQRLRALGYVD